MQRQPRFLPSPYNYGLYRFLLCVGLIPLLLSVKTFSFAISCLMWVSWVAIFIGLRHMLFSLLLFLLLHSQFVTLSDFNVLDFEIYKNLLLLSAFLPLTAQWSLDVVAREDELPDYYHYTTFLLGVLNLSVLARISPWATDVLVFFGAVLFLPQGLWNLIWWLLSHVFQRDFTIFYDGECAFCKKGVLVMQRIFLVPGVTLKPAQEVAEINSLMEEVNSWVVQTHEGEKKIEFDAVLYVFRQSPILFLIGHLFKVNFLFSLGTKVYRWVATHRPLVGNLTKGLSSHRSYTHLLNLTKIAALLWHSYLLVKEFFVLPY